jgi:serine/threonine protein kinase
MTSLSFPAEENSREPIIKIIDFGHAKDLNNIISCTTASCPTTVFNHTHQPRGCYGTEIYLAPEVLKKREYSKSSDVWSLGIILYKLLIGLHPFESELLKNDKMNVLQRIKTAEPNFVEKYWANISSEARELIRSMLVKDPSRRLTAEAALDHQWFQLDSATIESNELKRTLKEIKVEQLKKILRKVVAGIQIIRFLEKAVGKRKSMELANPPILEIDGEDQA